MSDLPPTSRTPSLAVSAASFLAHPGEAAARLRAFDWTSHPLGGPATWPLSLQGAVHLMLAAGQPMCVFWGHHRFFFSNDAFTAGLGWSLVVSAPRAADSVVVSAPRAADSVVSAPRAADGLVVSAPRAADSVVAAGQHGPDLQAELWSELAPKIDFVLSGRGATWHEEQRLVVAQGDERVEHTLTYGCHPIYEPGAPNDVGGVLLFIEDVSERVRLRSRNLELELARAKALHALEAILDHSLDIILTLDEELRIVQVSRSGEGALGLAREALLGRPFAELVAPEDQPALMDELVRVLKGEQLAGFEAKVLRAEGSAVPIHWSATWVEAERKVFAVGRDLSERLDIERRLRSAQRLEAIGRLAGRIAHDFNNVLAVVLGNSELLVELLAEDEVARPLAELITQAAERGASQVSRVLAYSQRQHLDRHRLDPATFLEAVRQRLVRTLHHHTSLELRVDPGAWPSLIDISQLETTVEDLVSNAADAMPNGGRILIHCDNFTTDREATLREAIGLVGSRHEVTPGDYLRIVVEDEGEGMTPEVLASAFEPFYTTKDVGKGTGLGLSMVLGFIRQSEGHVGVVTRLGRGTRVTLLLPRFIEGPQEEVAPVENKAQATSDSDGGAPWILVVDDEPAMRKHVVAQLIKAGFRVTGAADAREALTHLEGPHPCDLLFTDILMPGGMNGRQLADAARRLRPDLKVLYTSGYTAEALVGRAGGEIAADLLLTKPYRKSDLLDRVKRALSSS